MDSSERDLRVTGLLVWLDIPQHVEKYRILAGIGPSDPDYFHRYEAKRRESEAAAISKLQSMSDAEIQAFATMPRRIENFAQGCSLADSPAWYSGGFCVAGFEPDWNCPSSNDLELVA